MEGRLENGGLGVRDLQQLRRIATEIRKGILVSTTEAGSGHPGGSLSSVEILTALYFDVMKTDPENPQWEGRDRFVLSKGHAAPVLYATLAERGFFGKEELKTLRQVGSMLQGHPDMNRTPGVDASTGSLGQGLSFACGLALSSMLDQACWRVYAVVGDGESQEGQIWEAAMFAAHYRLSNLTVFQDWNGLQIDGPCEQVMNPYPLDAKWTAFGWNVLVIDGHDFGQIFEAVDKARECAGRPTVIIAKTVKGKGVSFMESQAQWHGKAASRAELQQALASIEKGGVACGR
jgi:transketolase